MARRSLRASSQGIQDIKKALKRKKWSQTYIAGAADCSRQTIWSLLQGKPTDCDVFMEVCTQVGLKWEEIAEPELPEPEQNARQDIDALVQEVRSHCCEAILDSYSKIRLPDDTRIDVDLLYVDVYVLEKLSSKRYASKSGLLEGVEQREDYERLTLGQQQERLPGQEIVRQFPRLMVLGKPGSGKTTFLRHLAVDCSKGKFFCDRIPILIELRSIKEGNSFNLLNLIHREFGLAQQEQTQQILNLGKAFILLDGLDEVSSQLRQSVRDQIYEFAKEYRKNRFVLTCRTQTIEYIAAHFEPIEVANFDAEQVKTFARNWFTATPETSGEAEGWTSRFVGKLEENQQIRELAVTPILLTLTCLLFTAEQDLPTKRSELYEKGINLLLKQWDRFREIPRDYQQLSVSAKQKLLSYLAFRKFEQPDNFILFEQDEIQGYIAEYLVHLGIEAEESEAILRAIEAHHGLLIERAQGFWSFSHLTFQEYFAAKYIADSFNSEEAFRHLVTHITEPHWRSVFLLTSGLTEKADELLELMEITTRTLMKSAKLQTILQWTNQTTDSLEGSLELVVKRTAALIIFNVIAFDVVLSFINDFIITINNRLNLGDALNLAYEIIHKSTEIEQIRHRFTKEEHKIPYDQSVHLDDTHKLKTDSIFKLAQRLKWNLHCRILIRFKDLKIFKEVNYDVLANTLEGLREALDDNQSFNAMNEIIRQAWLDTLHLEPEWIDLSEEEAKVLANYLYANELMVRCKEATQVSPQFWEDLEARILTNCEAGDSGDVVVADRRNRKA